MKTAVIVEDNLITLRAIEEQVQWDRLGFSISGKFTDGTEAADFCALHPPDLLIADILLPGQTGLELSKRLKELHPRLIIILISAHDKFAYAQAALSYGVFDYLLKPLSYPKLEAKICSALEHMERQSHLTQELEKAKPLLKEEFAKALINGQFSSHTIAKEAEFLSLSLPQTPATVFILNIEHSGDKSLLPPRNEFYLHFMEIREKLRECLKHRYIIEFQSQHQQITGIAWIPNDPLGYEDLLDSLRGVLREKREHSPWSVTIGVGNPVDSLESLSLSQEEAAKALEFEFFTGKHTVIPFATISEADDGKPITYPEDLETELHSILTVPDDKKFSEGIERFLELLTSKAGDKETLLVLVVSIISRVGLELKPDDGEKTFAGITTLLNRGKRAKTVDQLLELTSSTLTALRREVLSFHHSPESETLKSIRSFIWDNYTKPGLGVQEIADYVGYTPNYLSSYFKEKTGTNLLEYIQRIRIDKAKTLLRSTDSLMLEIAELSGFSNQYYFSVLFKRFTGMTPREYRKAGGPQM